MHDLVTLASSNLAAFGHDAVKAAMSPLAIRAYAILAGALVLLGSLAIAYRQRAWLMSLRPGQFQRSFQGPRPKRKATIAKQLKQLDDFKRLKLMQSLFSIVGLVVCGFVVPCALATALVMYLSWFSPTAHFLAVEGRGPLLHPNLHETAFFVLSQLALGVAGKPVELATFFGHSIANVNYDSSSIVSVLAVFGFRDFEGLFTGVFGHFSWTMLRVLTTTTQREAELRNALERLVPE